MSDSYIAVSPGLLTLQALMTGDISYAQCFTYGWDQYWENVEPLYTPDPARHDHRVCNWVAPRCLINLLSGPATHAHSVTRLIALAALCLWRCCHGAAVAFLVRS